MTCEILTAINEAADPKPSRYAPIEAVADLLKQWGSMTSENAHQAAEIEVDKATNAGYLTPAMRNWAVLLCTQDPASFAGFTASATPAYAHLIDGSGLDNRHRRNVPAHPPVTPARSALNLACRPTT